MSIYNQIMYVPLLLCILHMLRPLSSIFYRINEEKRSEKNNKIKNENDEKISAHNYALLFYLI